MNPIIHIAIKVPDLKKSIQFYETVFGYRVREIREYAGHRACHLDGAGIDLSLIQYDSEESPQATLAGEGPTIHHMGIEVDDLPSAVSRLREKGCEILSDPNIVPVKFRSPDGIVSELFTRGFFD